jgi:hypothetical protein
LLTAACAIAVNELRCLAKHGLKEADFGLADFKLRRMDADGDAAGTRINVVAAECTLVAGEEAAFFIQGQGLGRDDTTSAETLENGGGDVGYAAHGNSLS